MRSATVCWGRKALTILFITELILLLFFSLQENVKVLSPS